MTDEQLVAAASTGDMVAFRELVERYQTPLLRYATYLIHDPDIADDVVQDTFIKAYRNLRGFRLDAKFSSWIYRIAHNAAMDAVKHSANIIDDPVVLESLASDKPSVSEIVDDNIATEDIDHCLSQLPLKYREAVALHYLQDKSYREVSDILHTSVSAVGVRISRAKRMLRVICNARGVKS